MGYFFSKVLNMGFDEARNHVEDAFKSSGFGVVSEIDMSAKFKEKLGKDFRKYKILGVCSPKHAFEAVNKEKHIGLMLPCNVVIQEDKDGILVSAIDPAESMKAIENESLESLALEIRSSIERTIEQL